MRYFEPRYFSVIQIVFVKVVKLWLVFEEMSSSHKTPSLEMSSCGLCLIIGIIPLKRAVPLHISPWYLIESMMK